MSIQCEMDNYRIASLYENYMYVNDKIELNDK